MERRKGSCAYRNEPMSSAVRGIQCHMMPQERLRAKGGVVSLLSDGG